MSDIFSQKISELQSSTGPSENAYFPLSEANSDFSEKVSVTTLRETIGFENAFPTIAIALLATKESDVFFVYEDENKENVLGYVNQGNGSYSALMTDTNVQLRYATSNFVVNSLFFLRGTKSFEELRTIKPWYEGQRIKLKSYYVDRVTGGGEFIGRIASKSDDGGVVAAGLGFYWERVYDKTKQEINVLWFGADPTGVLSSTVSFQSALNFLTNGGRITVPAGRFSIRTLTYTYDYTELVGAGINATILFSPPPAGRGWMIKMNGLTECALKNLTMDSLYTSVEGSFWMGGGVRCVVDSCSFLNGHYCTLSINGANGVSGGGRYAYDNVVRNCYASGQRNYHPTGTSPFIAGNGAAVGGETSLTPPWTFSTVPAIYINGSKQVLNKHYEVDSTGLKINLSKALKANDVVEVLLGGSRSIITAQVSGTPAEILLTLGQTTGATKVNTSYGVNLEQVAQGFYGVNSFDDLRNRRPNFEGEKVNLKGYYAGVLPVVGSLSGVWEQGPMTEALSRLGVDITGRGSGRKGKLIFQSTELLKVVTLQLR